MVARLVEDDLLVQFTNLRQVELPLSHSDTSRILCAAAAVIIRQGYDKTTMSDIAEEAGVSRGTVYLSFKGKEELFEALLYWEWMQYAQSWLELWSPIHAAAPWEGSTGRSFVPWAAAP